MVVISLCEADAKDGHEISREDLMNDTASASTPASASASAPPTPPTPPTLGALTRVFLKIGLLSFGGPAGQIALMHRMIVDERRWLDEKRYLDALNFCMLLPGPEAQQLATFVGWHLHRLKGALIAGILFVAPGALAMLVLAWAYAAFGEIAAVEAAFYGVKAGVLAIVVEALLRVGRRALKSRAAWGIAALAFLALFAFAVPYPIVVIAAALAGTMLLGKTPPAAPPTSEAAIPRQPGGALRRTATVVALGLGAWALPVIVAALVFGPHHVLIDIAAFFSKLAVVTFGGAYAVLAWMATAAVETYGWLNAGEMLDGLGLAETTPGPLILVTQFVGFLAGWRNPAPLDPLAMGLLAAAMTTWVTFTPSILWILLGAPLVDRIGRMPALSAALSGITAAVVGVIFNLSLWFAFHVLFGRVEKFAVGLLSVNLPAPATLDPVVAGLALVAAYVLFGRHWSVAATVSATAALGIVVRLGPGVLG
jgi:chromate transporter